MNDDEDIAVKSLATAFQFGVALGFAKKYNEMHKVVEEVKKAITPESCDNCISRQVVKDKYKERLINNLTDNDRGIDLSKYAKEPYKAFCKFIDSIPPVTLQPKEGRWIDADGDNAICGCCYRLNHLYGTYCKHCGAKMHEL